MHVVASWSIGNAGSVSNSVALRNSSKSFGFGHCAPREHGSGPMSQTFWSPGETDQLELPMAVRLSIESAIHHRKGIAPFWPWHMMPRWKPIASDGKWTLFSWWEWSLFKFEWQLMSPPMVGWHGPRWGLVGCLSLYTLFGRAERRGCGGAF